MFAVSVVDLLFVVWLVLVCLLLLFVWGLGLLFVIGAVVWFALLYVGFGLLGVNFVLRLFE